MRSPTSSEHACPTSSLLCGRLLVALVESVLRPGGWENMCGLMCHCVRHISLDNKHGRSVEAIHSSRHVGRPARSSVPAHGKSRAARRALRVCFVSSMGSEKRHFEVQPEVHRDALNPSQGKALSRTRRYIADRLLFPHSSMQSQRRRKATSARRVLRAARSNLGGN